MLISLRRRFTAVAETGVRSVRERPYTHLEELNTMTVSLRVKSFFRRFWRHGPRKRLPTVQTPPLSVWHPMADLFADGCRLGS